MSGVFGGGGKSTSEERYTGLQLQTSSYGKPVPIGWGTSREAPNLLWYGSFVATPHTESMGGKGGGGGATHTSYTYQAAVVMGLGEGTVPTIGTVWADKQQTSLSALGFTLFTGAQGQATWSFLTTNHPTQAIPYSGTAYVANGALQLGNTPALPNLNFELAFGIRHNPGGGVIDAEPSAIVNDYLTNQFYGANFPYLHAGTFTGPNNWRTYCISMGFFLSPVEKTQRPAVEFIDEMAKITNSEPLWSEGVLKIIPYADAAVSGNGESYVPNLTPLYSFTDDDYTPEEGEDPVIVTIKPPSETFNVVRIEFLDRALQYNTNIAEAKDDQDIAIRGLRVMPTVRFECIKDLSVARHVAQLMLQRQLCIRLEFKFRVRPDYCLLEGMDIVEINEDDDIVDQLVRVTEAEDDEDDRLTITAEELPIGPGGAPRYNWQLAQGYAVNYAASPGNVNAPAIINVPRLLADSANGGYEVWIAVSGANANWGGCNVFVSFDNVQYQHVGRVYGPARYGTITAGIGAGADPDTSTTLPVLLNDTDLDLVSGTTADADNLRNLIWVDGEIMSFQTATLTGPGAYNLSYLRRGKYGTLRAAHSSGTRFVRLDPAIFKIPYDAGLVGQTVYFKFQSFNVYNFARQDIAALPAYTHVLNAFGPTGENAADASGVVFLEKWDFQNWEVHYNNRANSGVVVTYPADGELGGRVIQAAGGRLWIAHQDNIPYDPNALYRITAKVRRTVAAPSAGSRVYVGVEGVAADGVTLINTSGLDSYSSQHYNCMAGFDLSTVPLNQWVIATGYFKGLDILKYGPSTNISDPAVLRTGVRYFRPLLVLNYDTGTGTQQCDYIRVDVVNPSIGANLLRVDAWTAGALTGPIGNFALNQSAAGENQIINGTGPFGVSQLLWECRCVDAAVPTEGNANGGWNNTGDLAQLDATKSYRSVVWVRRRLGGTNRFYHGCGRVGDTVNLDGSANSNPYFLSTISLDLFTIDKYYMSVGIIHGSGYTGGQSGMSGIWDPATGRRVIAGVDYRMAAGATTQEHRAYMYYGGNTTTRMDLTDPRFEVMDGTEPSLLSLLGLVGTGMLSPNAATEPDHQFTIGPITSTHGNGTVAVDTFPLGVMSSEGLLVVTVSFDGRHAGSGSGHASIMPSGHTGGTHTGATGVRLIDSTDDSNYILRAFVPVNIGDNVTLTFNSTHKNIPGSPPGLNGTSTLLNIDYEVEFIKR